MPARQRDSFRVKPSSGHSGQVAFAEVTCLSKLFCVACPQRLFTRVAADGGCYCLVIAVGADAPHCTDFEGSGDPCLKFDLLARQTPALAVVTVLARWEPHRPNASQSTSPASDVVIAFKF